MRVNLHGIHEAWSPNVVSDVKCATCGPDSVSPDPTPCAPVPCTTDVQTLESLSPDDSDWTMVHQVEEKWVKLVRP
jgi:hypothetical protein